MRRRSAAACAWAAAIVILGGVGGAVAAPAARDAGARHPGAQPAASASAAEAARALPPGHPAVDPGQAPSDLGGEDDDGDEQLPPGHPQPRGGPHAGQPEERLPEDTSDIDPSLPPGTIVAEIRDAKDQPIPKAEITLGILQNSVAKGESRRRVVRAADDSGLARFDGLDFGGGIAYRVSVPWSNGTTSEPATYAAPPFQLDLKHGQRVRVHVYPATNRINETLLGMDSIVYIELKDDALQFEELFRVFNLGANTWLPSDVVVNLPAGFKAFNAQKEMSDVGFDEAPGRGAKLRGTFGPGQHEATFRYQVPYSGDESVELTVGLPPHVAGVRVIAEASKGMNLHVNDMPGAQSTRNQRGQRVLVTERQLRAGEQPMSQLHITLDNIPTEGPARWITTAIAAATVGLGLYLAFEQEKSRSKTKLGATSADTERARNRLVAEIAALDRAHKAGDVGPKAYDRIRSALVDALARLLATEA